MALYKLQERATKHSCRSAHASGLDTTTDCCAASMPPQMFTSSHPLANLLLACMCSQQKSTTIQRYEAKVTVIGHNGILQSLTLRQCDERAVGEGCAGDEAGLMVLNAGRASGSGPLRQAWKTSFRHIILEPPAPSGHLGHAVCMAAVACCASLLHSAAHSIRQEWDGDVLGPKRRELASRIHQIDCGSGTGGQGTRR